MTALYKKTLIVVIVVGLLSAGFIWYIDKQSERLVFEATSQEKIHYADDPSINISSISIKAFYFVPKDRAEQLDKNWQANFTASLSELKKFYTLQLNNVVWINFDVYPQPVIGQLNTQDYDGGDTAAGNPSALLAIQSELTNRVFRSEGDLYQEFFADNKSDSFRVMGILYEGVGSTATILKQEGQGDNLATLQEGSLPAFLVSDYYFTSPSYKDYAQTILAHEFGHTLGLLDSYDLATNIPYTDDIMGGGRFRPLSTTYISFEAKKTLGLTY